MPALASIVEKETVLLLHALLLEDVYILNVLVQCPKMSRLPVRPNLPHPVYRMAQKNFFSLKGFSDAGTGDRSGSSLAWASQYDIKSAAALDTFILSMLASIFSCSTSFLAWAMHAVLLDAMIGLLS